MRSVTDMLRSAGKVEAADAIQAHQGTTARVSSSSSGISSDPRIVQLKQYHQTHEINSKPQIINTPVNQGFFISPSTNLLGMKSLSMTDEKLSFPVVKDKYKTQAFVEHGYMPNDPDYQTIYSDIDKKQSDIVSGRSQIRSDIFTVLKSPVGSTFDIDGTVYNQKDALSRLLMTNYAFMRGSKMLAATKKSVERYEQGGFNVDITGSDISFSEPSASEIWDWKYGDGALGTSRIIAGSAMELGIPAFLSGAASFISGNRDYWSNEIDRQKGKLLNLSMHKGEEGTDVLSYGGRFWTSGEAIESFWLPVATIGMGYVYTGIKAGAIGASTTGILASTGAKYGSTIVKTIDKTLFGVGLIGSAASGASIGSSFAYENAGLVPTGSGLTSIGKVASGWTLAAGGFKAGEMWYNTASTVKPNIYDAHYRTPDEVFTLSNRKIYAEEVLTGEGDPFFTGNEKGYVFVSERRPFVQYDANGRIVFDSQLTGVSASGDQGALSKGVMSVSRNWTGRWDTKYSSTSFYDFKAGSLNIVKANSSGYEGFFDAGKFISRSTGIKTSVEGYSIIGLTGASRYIPESISYDFIGDSTYESPVSVKFTEGSKTFTEYESLSLGRFRVGGKDIGMGLDYSRTYLRDISGGLGGGSGTTQGGFIIGGGSTLSGQGSIGTLYSSGGSVLGSVKSVVPSTSSVVSSSVSGSSSSVFSLPGGVVSGSGLMSVPRSININRSRYVSIPRISSLVDNISSYKVSSIQSPVLISGLKFDTLQTPVSINQFSTVQVPVSSYRFDTVQTPIRALRVDTLQTPVTELVQIPKVQVPVIPTIQTPVIPKFVFPFGKYHFGGSGGGWDGWFGKGYRFRHWKVPKLSDLLGGKW